jgi:hypothetical protein
MTWTRHARTILAHELLQGTTTPSDPHPRGWSQPQEYPKPGSKRERAARSALARELRRGDERFINMVAAMIDPRNKSSIIKQKIEFTPKDRRCEPKISGRRKIEIAAFMHEWLSKHPGQNITSAVVEAAKQLGLADGIIWDAWKIYKPILPPKK